MGSRLRRGFAAPVGEDAPASNRYLVRGAPGDFGDYYRYQIGRQVYPALEHLHRGIRGDPSAVSSAFFGGGGSGAFSIALCRAHPRLHATVIDFPNVVAVAARFVDEAGLSSRISCLAGDALQVDWRQECDAVLMSYLLSAVGPDEGARLLDRAAAALVPGGLLIIHDFMLDEDRSGPTLAALWFLQYLAYRADCASFTASEIGRLLSERGFVDVTTAGLIHEVTSVVTGHKPM